VEDLSLLSGEEIHAPGSFLVMFNGLILGKHREPQVLFIIELTLVLNVSIFFHDFHQAVHAAFRNLLML
jgi:hypothetical protein